MDAAEQSLLQALDVAPHDWSIRLLVAERMLERDAANEAAELLGQAPSPPATDEQLQRAVEIGGHHALAIAQSYTTGHPSSGYGHQLLGTLLEHHGDAEQAAQHFEVARALGFADAAEPAVHHEPVEQVAPEAPPAPHPGTHPPRPSPAVFGGASTRQEPIDRPKKRAGSTVTAVFVAIGIHLLIGLVAAILVILPPAKDDPEIVAAIIGPPSQKQEMQKKNVVKQVKKSTSAAAAAAPVAQLMRANAMAKFSLPKVTKTSTGPLGMGEGNLGSGGFGGAGSGLGSGASFFGGSATGNRFLFVIDHSGSMRPNQVKLRNDELARALKSLKGVQYQVLLFAGGAYYAQEGWSIRTDQKKTNIAKDPRGRTYEFVSKRGAGDYEFKGLDSGLPKTDWLDANTENVKKTMSFIQKNKLFYGTDWELALRIGHYMDPPPDVIFFMSDGSGGNNPPPILSMNKKRGKPQINTIAMQTKAGAAQFAAIAKGTEGKFTIVDKRGKPIDGFEFLKNPGKFNGRL